MWDFTADPVEEYRQRLGTEKSVIHPVTTGHRSDAGARLVVS
jgi:hypothetical protein